jgi:hypothetical protein
VFKKWRDKRREKEREKERKRERGREKRERERERKKGREKERKRRKREREREKERKRRKRKKEKEKERKRDKGQTRKGRQQELTHEVFVQKFGREERLETEKEETGKRARIYKTERGTREKSIYVYIKQYEREREESRGESTMVQTGEERDRAQRAAASDAADASWKVPTPRV